jgi:hypothetical protein
MRRHLGRVCTFLVAARCQVPSLQIEPKAQEQIAVLVCLDAVGDNMLDASAIRS